MGLMVWSPDLTWLGSGDVATMPFCFIACKPRSSWIDSPRFGKLVMQLMLSACESDDQCMRQATTSVVPNDASWFRPHLLIKNESLWEDELTTLLPERYIWVSIKINNQGSSNAWTSYIILSVVSNWLLWWAAHPHQHHQPTQPRIYSGFLPYTTRCR